MSCHPFFYVDFKKEITPGYSFLSFDPDAKNPKIGVFHPGHDYNKNNGKGGNGDLNEPIHVCKRGIVRYAQDTKGGYGLLTVVEHEDGTYSKYAHQNKILVKVGQTVEEGEVIGLAGKSGTSSVHCHHELLTAKLVEYLKKLRPNNWYTFYPKEKSKAWVVENYINPLVAHTYSPPQAEIKKNMTTISAIILIDKDLQYNSDLLASSMKEVHDFYFNKSGGLVNFRFYTLPVNIPTPQWTPISKDYMSNIKATWAAFYLVPFASGYDVCITWIKDTKWQSPDSLAYSAYEKILGVHFIATMVPENYTDDRWKGRYDGRPFTGVLAHENGHMLNQRCTSGRRLNDGPTYQPGQDNTHYFDLIVKDLSPILKEIPFDQFSGWVVPLGYKRMFAYGNPPTNKKWNFSGTTGIGRLYRSSDSRMFFAFTDKGWTSITETEFNGRIKQGETYTEMAVQEANKIQIDILKLPVPGFIAKSIISRVVKIGWEDKWLKLAGWIDEIPNKHLL